MAKPDPAHHPPRDPSSPIAARHRRGSREGQPKHRFRFGERWERHRQRRSVSRAWLILGLDLVLLLVIVTLTRMLVKRLQ